MTNYSLLLSEMHSAFPGLSVLENEPLSKHCSFRIGGAVPALISPSDPEQLAEICHFFRQKGIKPFLMGNGTNLLFPDEGLARPVIRLCPEMGGIAVSGNRLTAESGAPLSRVAVTAMNAGLAGLAFAHGIPGSAGGGVIMNAGAYGGELKDVVTETDYLDEDLKLCTVRGTEHGFSYRHSIFSGRECVILRTVFSLCPGEPEAIAEKMRELAEKRKASQPLDMPSAGSTFKRPADGYAAALIDKAGLKGFSVGGAQVSPKHSGFVVNTGNAVCGDVLRLMEHVQKTVFSRFGVMLEPEVLIVRR